MQRRPNGLVTFDKAPTQTFAPSRKEHALLCWPCFHQVHGTIGWFLRIMSQVSTRDLINILELKADKLLYIATKTKSSVFIVCSVTYKQDYKPCLD